MADLTVAELIARTEAKIEAGKILLATRRASADEKREQWRVLDENCRELEERIAHYEALVAEAKTVAA